MGLCSCLVSCLAWGVQHWSLLAVGGIWVLALRWRSLGELSLIDITWVHEVSGGPMSWTRLSHLRGSGLTLGQSTKTLSATRLWEFRQSHQESSPNVKDFKLTNQEEMPALSFLLMVSFAVPKLLSLMWSHLLIFAFVALAWGDRSKKILLRLISKSILLMFSSRSFMVSGLRFKSLIQFEFIFVYDVRKWPSFILLHVAVQFSQHHFLKRLSFPHCIFLTLLW